MSNEVFIPSSVSKPVVFNNENLFELDVVLQGLGYIVFSTSDILGCKEKHYMNPNTGEALLLGES